MSGKLSAGLIQHQLPPLSLRLDKIGVVVWGESVWECCLWEALGSHLAFCCLLVSRWEGGGGHFFLLDRLRLQKSTNLVVTIPSLARIFGECSPVNLCPRFLFFLFSSFFSFFFLKWRLAHSYYFHSLCQDQSTSGSASWDDCGRVFLDKLRVS